MIRILCNRCGADITTGKAFGEVMVKLHESPDFDTPFKWVAGENDDEHYCEECVKEIAQFVHTPPKTEQGTESPPQEKESAGKQGRIGRRIDYGKIAALRNAGWDNAKIADEMRMTKGAVAQAVSKCRKGGMLNEAKNERAIPDNEGAV